MKTQLEKYDEMMEKVREAGWCCSADDMKVSLLSSIAESIAIIADNTRLKDCSDIKLANSICDNVKKCRDDEEALRAVGFELEKVLNKPMERDFYNFKNKR